MSSPAQAQRNSAVNRSVTSGIGSASNFRNVPPRSPPPLAVTPRPFHFYAPLGPEPKREEAAGASNARATRVVPKEPPPEDPRTMITRDRIESPQHR
jgi:hypothetical protein